MSVIATEILSGLTIAVDSPDGKVFVHCDEEDGKLVRVMINIGKAGAPIHPWADAMGRMITGMLATKDIIDILTELSNLTTAKSVYNVRGFHVRSGPDAIFYALILYAAERRQTQKSVSVNSYRPPMGRLPKSW